MVMYAKIRRMFYREHLSISEIQRRTGLSRNTIKKWLKAPGAGIAKSPNALQTILIACKAFGREYVL
jgi:transposase